MLGMSCTSIGVAFLFPLVMICVLSDSARYRLKFLFFIVTSLLATTIFVPLMLFRIRDWRNALMPAWCLRQVSKLLGVRYIVRGEENIVNDTGCVVLINHQSSLDLIVLAELWPRMDRSTVIAKKAVLYLGLFGLASWLWGTIFIDRLKVEEAHNTINAAADTISSAKAKLLLFPEGKRHSGTSLLPFKKGGFHVAIACQAPIQPVVVSRYYFLNDKLKKFESGNNYITILPPIPTKGLTKADLASLMERTYEVMNKTFVETSQEALSKHIESLKAAQ